jgi:lecithin-cholesterol acyltransferase
MLVLLPFARALNPVILVPGLMRSQLAATVNFTTIPSCPQNLTDEPIWIRSTYLLPPTLKCTLEWLTLVFDNETQSPATRQNVAISVIDFGGVEGLRGTGPKLFGSSVPPYFGKLIKRLESHGYEVGKSLFGAPYDFRYGLSQPPAFWEALRSLCERAFHETGERVKFLTHSFGGFLIHHFLSQQTTPEWRRHFVHSAVFTAPSWSGSGQSLIVLWRQRAPFLKFYKNQAIAGFVGAMAGLHVHAHNPEIYANTTVFIYRKQNISGAEVRDFLTEHGKVVADQRRIADCNWRLTDHAPVPLDVPARILYNSGWETPFGLRIEGDDDEGKVLYRPGDGIVGSEGLDYVCREWKRAGADVECVDLNSTRIGCQHAFMIFKGENIKRLIDWILEPSSTDEL